MIQQFFTEQGSSHLVIALILYVTAKPFVQGASRLTEFLIHLFGTAHDPRKRNMVISAELAPGYQDLVGDTVIREPLLPGLLLFSFTYLDSTQVVTQTAGAGVGELATIFAALFAFSLFRVMASLKRSATRSALPVAHSISAIGGLLACGLALAAGLSLEAIAAALIASLFCAQAIALIARGIRNYGLFSVFWIPVGAFSWLCRVFALTIAAPIVLPLMLIEQFTDQPLKKPCRTRQTPASA